MEDFDYQSARDIDLGFVAAATSPRREQGWVGALMQRIFGSGCRMYFRLWHRLEIVGSEQLPPPPFIMIANHASHLDALVLGSILPVSCRVRARPLAAGEVFFPRPVRAVLSSLFLGALPVWRGQATPHVWQTYRERLVDEKLVYILFPEGTRSRDGNLQQFKAGWAVLLSGQSVRVPVVPCRIQGSFEALPPGVRWPRPRRVRVVVGSPLVFDSVSTEREAWQRVAATCRGEIDKLGT